MLTVAFIISLRSSVTAYTSSRKTKKSWLCGFGPLGVEKGQKSEKTAFSEKAKCLLSFKKKIGSLAPELIFLALVECRAYFRVVAESGSQADLRSGGPSDGVKIGKSRRATSFSSVGLRI